MLSICLKLTLDQANLENIEYNFYDLNVVERGIARLLNLYQNTV